MPLPPGTQYDDFLNWLSLRRGSGFGINSTLLTGRVEEDGAERIEIEAEFEIIIHRDNEWVRVPLGLTEAFLTNVEHEFQQEQGPAQSALISYEGFSNETGHAWSFFGRGEHRLRLSLTVPVTNRSDETRLILGTPANSATTRLRLDVPAEFELTPAAGIVQSAVVSGDRKTVEWIGPGGRLDLAWRPKPPVANPTDLAVSTTLFPSLSGKSVQIRAVQKISASRGNVSALRVQLPAGFQLESIVGAQYRTHTEEKLDDGRVIVVQLADATDGTFELTWRVNAPLPADGQIAIEGFLLPDVPLTEQSGQVWLERSAGYDVVPVDTSTGVQRLEMPEVGTANMTAVYGFPEQPFRLDLRADAISPTFAVTPNLTFQVVPERLDLEAKFEFDVEVRKGELREVRFNWPADDWSVTQVRVGPIQEFKRATDAASPIDIQVPTTSSSHRIPIRASRPLEDAYGTIRIPIPRLESTGQQKAESLQNEAILSLRYPTNFAVTATALGEGTLRKPTDPSKTAGLPARNDNERLTVYVVSPEVREIALDVRRLGQEITASATVSVRPRGENLRVEERIDLDILHEPLSAVRLMVPETLLAQGIEFVDGSNTPLAMRTTGKESNGHTEVEVALDGSVVGPISIATRFDVRRPATPDQAADALLPLVTPAQTKIRSALLRVARLPRHSVSVGNKWVRNQSTRTDGQDHWITAAPSGSVPIRLVPRSETDLRSYTVSQLLMRSVLNRDGDMHTVADCRFERPPALVAIHFPQALTPESFKWRGQSVEVDVISEEEGQLVEIPLDAGNGPPVLSVSFRTDAAESFGLVERRTLEAFEFGEDVAVEQTLWQLTLPESHHLFSGPSRYVSRFRWGLDGGFWTRRADGEFRESADWFGEGATPLGADFEAGHQYAFSRLGQAVPLSFSAISRSLVVLIGAGAAILIGYVFANGLVPNRRVALASLAAVLLLLWACFPNQLQIFVQPALFGLALVAAAAMAEWVLQRRQERLSSSAPASAVDFVTILPGDGSTSSRPAAIGSEEPTVLRTGRTPEPVSSHEPGSNP